MKVKTLSHIVLVSRDVPKMTRFLMGFLGIEPHYTHREFSDFVLPGNERIAVFSLVGKVKEYFSASKDRGAIGIGLTVDDVDSHYQKMKKLEGPYEIIFSGPPKDHPWGEKSYLLIDPDGNRWEITQSPQKSGKLVNR